MNLELLQTICSNHVATRYAYCNIYYPQVPFHNHCFVVAYVVNKLLAFPIYYCVIGEIRHYYNLRGEEIIDLTKAQFTDEEYATRKGNKPYTGKSENPRAKAFWKVVESDIIQEYQTIENFVSKLNES